MKKAIDSLAKIPAVTSAKLDAIAGHAETLRGLRRKRRQLRAGKIPLGVYLGALIELRADLVRLFPETPECRDIIATIDRLSATAAKAGS